VWDRKGCILAAKSMTKLALAALYAVEFSRDLGLQSIIMKGDVVQVVNVVKVTEQNLS
jgi:hypothetical protein